jgi:hypothetical protein
MKRLIIALVATAHIISGNAMAAALQISKTPSLISDPVNSGVLPKTIPGAIVDYNILVKNPDTLIAMSLVSVIDDIAVPQGAEYFVGDLVGSGPVEFTDGNLLGLGLFGSGLSYTYTSLSSASDSIAFSNDGGITFAYTPVPDANGYDSHVTHIRVSPTGTFSVLSGFNLRLRVRIR